MKMARIFTFGILFVFALCFSEITTASQESQKNPLVYCVRIDGAISSPQVYIVRRAVREANKNGADFLVLDINTPGGEVSAMLEIIDVLGDFKGESVAYVNPDAVSAGAFIAAACRKIYFAPNGVMGAAEAVNGGGEDFDKSMQRKISSYLGAKARVFSGDNLRRADIIKAMNNPDFELKIGGKIIKKSGELLSLTAREAVEKIDAKPLLADGISPDIAALSKTLGGSGAKLARFEISWSESLAKYVSAISPILLGLGFLLIFIDIKSGAVGLFASLGGALVCIVFLGANMAGIAGYEEIIVFFIGCALVAAEIFLFSGTLIFGGLGVILMFGSIAWALGDIRPARGFEYNLSAIGDGFTSVGLGILTTCALLVVLWKFLPKSRLWGSLVLNSTNAGASNIDAAAAAENAGSGLVGRIGICVSDLNPAGRAEFDGQIIDVSSDFGTANRGDRVQIVSKKDFHFIVRKV